MIQPKQLEVIRKSHNLTKVVMWELMRTSMSTYKRWLTYDDVNDMDPITRDNYELRLFFLMIELDEFKVSTSLKGITGTITIAATKKLINWSRRYG